MGNPSTDFTRTRRRRLLQAAGSTTALALAGCLDGNNGDDGASNTTNEESNPDENSTEIGDSDPDEGSRTDEPAPEDLEQRAQEFAELLDSGDTDGAYELVTDGFAEQIPPGDMERFWTQQVAVFGAIEEFLSVEYRGEREDGAATVVARAALTERRFEFQYAFREGKIVEFLAIPVAEWTAPEYVDGSAFSETELALDGPGDCELGATLSLPDSDSAVPGVVLVHGSGDQDRDQTAGPNKTFRELAQGLASQGVAVLRYDQRTVACNVDRTTATLDDIVTDDAVTAVERLRAVEGVSEVFVAGHSLGGRVAPRIADRTDAAGLIMLAPLAEPIHEAIVRQTRHALTVDGELSERDEQAIADTEALGERIRTLDIGDSETINLGGGGARGRSFWRTLQEYDHIATAAELDVPMLLVQGGRDYLVTVEDDLPLWREAIGDKSGTQIVIFEDLNHRFQPGEGQSRPQEWSQPENPVDRRVVERVGSFLRDQL